MVTKVARKPLNGWRTSWNRMDCVSASAHPRRIEGARIGTNAGNTWDDRASHPCSRPSLKLFHRIKTMCLLLMEDNRFCLFFNIDCQKRQKVLSAMFQSAPIYCKTQ